MNTKSLPALEDVSEEDFALAIPRTGHEFEAFCEKLASDWVKKNFPNKRYKTIVATPSPVDIVIRWISDDDQSQSNLPGKTIIYRKKREYKDDYFIECKFHSRELGIDKLAAVILNFVRYRPVQMILASLTGLSNNASNYLQFFEKIEYAGDSEFVLWFPLQDDAHSCVYNYIPKGTSETLGRDCAVDDVTLQLEYLFSREVLDKKSIAHFLKSRPISIRFRAILTPPKDKAHKTLTDAHLIVFCPSYDYQTYPIKFHSVTGGNFILEAIIDGKVLTTNVAYTDWKLKLQYGKLSYDSEQLQLPPITLSRHATELPDFRKEKTQATYEYWRESNVPITFISGLSGIGKSHLCREICKLAAEDGFVTVSASMLHKAEVDFISSFAWAVLSPEMQRAMESNEDQLDTFIETWALASSNISLTEREILALSQLLSKGTIKDVASEALLGTLARMIVQRGVPTVLYLSDLHKATSVVAECIWKLIAGFSDAGWGQIRVILEQRDSDECEHKLHDRLQTAHREKFWHCNAVSPVSEQQKVDILSKSLSIHNNKEVAKKILSKCGDDFQHLQVVLQTLLQEKALVASDTSAYSSHSLYSIPCLTKLEEELEKLSTARQEATERLLTLVHGELLDQGSLFGCYWMGLISIIEMSPDSTLLAKLTARELAVVEEELELLIDDDLLIRIGDTYVFKHESLGYAVKSWFKTQPRIRTWVRKNQTKEFIPERFEDGIARGRLWQYLNSPDNAFQAFNVAIAFAKDNFLQRIQSHMEIHTLLRKERVDGRHREFFENFSAIGWYGHYTLPIGRQLQLTKEAIEFHGTLDRIDYPDPEASRKLADLYRIAAWLLIQNFEPEEYFISVRKALQHVSSIHEIAMMLNRYMCICHHWGMTEVGIKGALMAITLCEEVPPELDCDLPSVNYAMGASLIADSSAGLNGRLRFAERALGNVYATERELVHTNLAYANTQTLLGKYDDAHTALNKAKRTMDEKDMESIQIYYYQSLGLLYAAQNNWDTACAAYSKSLTAALWLDQKLETLRVGHNLLLSYIKNDDFLNAERLFPSVLKICLTNASTSNYDEAKTTLNRLLEKSEQLLDQKSSSSVSLNERIKMKASEFGIELHATSRQNVFEIVFHTATVLTEFFPEYFNMSTEARKHLNRFTESKTQPITANSLKCAMQKDEIELHFIA